MQEKYLKKIDGTLYFNLEEATGRSPRNIPKDFGPYKDRVSVEQLLQVFGDPWIYTGSGGLIGDNGIAEFTGFNVRHLRRTLFKESWVRKVGNLHALNVSSYYAWLKGYNQQCSRNKKRPRNRQFTDVSG